jgi:molybdopterin-containing oxidoreductase family iron-sulfur binding subunit
MTAAAADEWIAPRPGTEGHLALALIHEILRSNLAADLPAQESDRIRALVAGFDPQSVSRLTDVPAERVVALAEMFALARPGLAVGGGVAVLGSNATATIAAVNLLNYVCGNINRTVHFGGGADLQKLATMKEIAATVELMRSAEIPLMFFYHTNPVHSLPAGSAFADALLKVAFKVSFSSCLDETAVLCDLILPDTTPLERWEDYSPRAGIHGIVQPAMEPLPQVKATPDFLLSVAKRLGGDAARSFPQKSFREYMEQQWREVHREFQAPEEFAQWFRTAVENGGVWRQETRRTQVSLGSLDLSLDPPRFSGTGGFHLLAYPSLHLFDGRAANRPWLQETPDPVTGLVWDSWMEIHPEAASRLAIQEGDLIRLTSPHGQLQVPAHITRSIRRDTVAIPIGQGHREYGRYAKERGVNVLELLSPEIEVISGGRQWAATRVALEKLAANRPLVSTRGHPTQEGRELARTVTLSEARRIPDAREPVPSPGAGPGSADEEFSLYPSHEHPQHRWGMAIDLNVCIGCNACIAACYAENNVAVVGKEQVRRGRHMAWIRIDRFEDAGSSEVRYLPVLCQHCDNGPCESVCPVYATYHNNEGLNAQIYNRCVGTRYCSNNCPYHVRRFNWYDYEWPYPMTVQLNPDITVRSKGVMEKCTFCVQRIRTAKDVAKDEGRKVRDGEVDPACAQTCPTEAIVFGDLKDPGSRVSQLARDARGYHVLGRLNTRPAITYLKKIENKV